MYPFSASLPKPLLPVCNKPLLAYHIEAMASLGIREVFIVIGHHGFEIVKALGAGDRDGVKIHYVDQEETIGIAHAVGKLEAYLDSPFLLFLGDIYFQTSELGRMLQTFGQGDVNAVLATKEESDPAAIRRNFAVIEGDDGFVRRVIEKPRHIVNTLKGCGLYLFDLHIFDAIRRTPRTAMRDEYEITDSIQILIDDGFKVKSLPVVEEVSQPDIPGGPPFPEPRRPAKTRPDLLHRPERPHACQCAHRGLRRRGRRRDRAADQHPRIPRVQRRASAFRTRHPPLHRHRDPDHLLRPDALVHHRFDPGRTSDIMIAAEIARKTRKALPHLPWVARHTAHVFRRRGLARGRTICVP